VIAVRAKYVFDTSPSIILLEKCRLRSQLSSFAKNHTLVAPKRVMEEYSVGDRENSKPDVSVFREIFSPIDVQMDAELLPFFYYDSSSGEIGVMSYARQHPNFTCVIDEVFARNVCSLMGIKVTGTIGIIREMKNCKLLGSDDLKAIRHRIKNCRFYLSKALLRELDLICDSL
jgi:predicted nucleic acid-binding protein